MKPTERNIDEILYTYHNYLLSKVSKVHILGETNERELRDVFVDLSIVDQPPPHQHAKFLGLMSFFMQRRFSPFADTNRNAPLEQFGQREKETKRRMKPDELLRHSTKAIVTGAPGSGKTTLFKYLALQAHEKEKRLVVWLELKAIDKPLFSQAEKAAARYDNLILQELWLKHLKIQLLLSDAEIKLLRQHWHERLKANEIAILLDGFDELQDEAIEGRLNKSVGQFVSALHNNTVLISTRPYAQHKLDYEGLRKLEIEPLNPRQIEAFLSCYYPNEAAAKSLLKTLREHSTLRELLHVPLLLGIILRLYRENRFTDERLKLYETIITDLVHELDRSKSVNRIFKISDERLRLDFLKFLAFERLLRDPLHEEDQEVSRIVFSYDLLKEKARIFLMQEQLSQNPRDLADDALATPLLLEISANLFAFTHLTLQEYLAACAFTTFYKTNEFQGLNIFCRAYHNPIIVEMEVLPMILGAAAKSDHLYAEIESWPESLKFTNLRLRARGLAYSPKITQQRIATLCEKLADAITGRDIDVYPYRAVVISSFANTYGVVEDLLINGVSNLLSDVNPYNRIGVIEALAMIGSERAVDLMLQGLDDKDPVVQAPTADFVGWTRSERAIEPLVAALQSDNVPLRWNATTALGVIGSENAVEPLMFALRDREKGIRSCAIEALKLIGTETAARALSVVSRGEESYLRQKAAIAMGEIGSESSIEDLIACLKDESPSVRKSIAYALKKINSNKTAPALRQILRSKDLQLRQYAIEALQHIASNEALEILLTASQDENKLVRNAATSALGTMFLFATLDEDDEHSNDLQLIGETNRSRAVKSLTTALQDEDEEVRTTAAMALTNLHDESTIPYLHVALQDNNKDVRVKAASTLGILGSKESVGPLLKTLTDEVSYVRAAAVYSLGEISSTNAIDPLLDALLDEDTLVRRCAAIALGSIGSKKAVEHLLKALKDEDYKVRACAVEALGQIGDECVFEPVHEMLRDSEVFVREQVVEALGRIGGERSLNALSSALKDKSGLVRARATEQIANIVSETAVDLLGTALRDPDINVNRRAAKALGKIRSEPAIEILIEALQDENHDTRFNAIEALAQIESESVVTAIFHVICNPASDLSGYASWYLAKCDKSELESAINNSLGNKNRFIRRRAAQIVGYYSDNQLILRELSRLAENDSDNVVRDVAKEAVEKLARKLELLGHFITEGTVQPLSDNISKESVLVHEVGLIVSSAGHFFREILKYDEGIDGEIEFRNDDGRGSGQRVYLQLKSGDSHLNLQESGKEIFKITKKRHAQYWQSQAYPVLLVIRDSSGQIRWMNVTEYLDRHGTSVKQIEFRGEPFTAESLTQMRARFVH
jgi:HEAT repeat protein